MKLLRITTAVLGVLLIATGCSTAAPPAATSSASSPSPATQPPAAAPSTVSQFVPQWLTFTTPSSWTEPERRITADFQQFGLRPDGENELPPRCNGCGVDPATAILTAYAPGKFDPAVERTGEPVTVTADNDGFFRLAADSGEAILTWPYAENSWATVRSMTTLTKDRGRMLDLARALSAKDAKIRLPLSIPDVPAAMPLSEIYVDNRGYGTTLHFIACPPDAFGRTGDCYGRVDKMRVQIWPADGYRGHIDERDSVAAKIGGLDGIFDSTGRNAAVQVRPGMLVVFELEGPSGQPGQPLPAPQANLKDILATLTWAPDPGNEQTWLPVTDWVK